ncbi:MAG: hypothetical protein JST62_02750 [Bacteroidetes bacterium]|nr:hypothetical protein [Bacteroidota bacterium]
MKNIFLISVFLLSLLCINCSDESRIEGLVFSDNIVVNNINKEIVIVPNSNVSTLISMDINGKTQVFSIDYTQYKNNGIVNQYIVKLNVPLPMGVMKSNGDAVYNLKFGDQIGTNGGYFNGYFSLLQTLNGNTTNNAANTVKLNEPFYIGFNTNKGSENAAYGWIQVTITFDKITISSYGYRMLKPLSAGEK